MTDRPKIVFGKIIDDNFPTLPAPTMEKQYILTNRLGLPDNLSGKSVLELFSGDTPNSFKPEVVSRNGQYNGIDVSESTGLGHITGNVYDEVTKLPPQVFDFVIMQHPPIWMTLRDEKRWKRENSTRLATSSLQDPEKLMKLIADCSRLIKPMRGNGIGIANGFIEPDGQEMWRRASRAIPDYSNWFIQTPLTGRQTEILLIKEKGGISEKLFFPEHAFRLTHL